MTTIKLTATNTTVNGKVEEKTADRERKALASLIKNRLGISG